MGENTRVVKALSFEGVISAIMIFGFLGIFAYRMGVANMLGTMMATGHDLVLNTCLFISAVCMIAGALGALLTEFGVLALINRILLPLMRPLYDLPGAAVVAMMATYLSDNPALLSLAADKGFSRYFKKYQYISLTNLGTAFGMGLIVCTFMAAQGAITGESYISAVACGIVGAVVGSLISVRLMQQFTKRAFGTEAGVDDGQSTSEGYDVMAFREVREGGRMQRFIEALLDGAKNGLNASLLSFPGVAVICTIVMMLTNGPGPNGEYTGAAYQGIALIPAVGRHLNVILDPLFGFKDPSAVIFPLTSLGAVGAALGTVTPLLREGRVGANEIAVFTAMGMCWSGYLSTHIAMMEAIGARSMTMKAIGCHTIGGLAAGIVAHLLYTAIA